MRVGDLVEQLITSPLPDPAGADPVAVRQTFVPTSESLEVIRRVLEGTSQSGPSHRAPFLLLGRRGVGKTHLLRYLLPLLGDPEDPVWDEMEQKVPAIRRPVRPLRGLLLDVSEDSGEPLDDLLCRRFGWDFESLRAGSEDLPDLLALDGLSPRFGGGGDHGRTQEDLERCTQLSEAFAEQGRRLIFAAEDRHVRPVRNTPGSAPLEALAAKCSVVWLSTDSLADVVSSALARKREGSRNEIVHLLNRLRSSLPQIDVEEEAFVRLYPVLPSLFAGLFSIREMHPRFSPASFVQCAVADSMERPAEELVTVTRLYDSLLPLLRKSAHGRTLVEAAEELERGATGRLQGEMRARSTSVIRAIAGMTVMGAESVDPVRLAHSLLLYDSSGTLPGFGLAAALLEHVEEGCPARLIGEGRGEARSYRLVCDMPAAAPGVRASRPSTASGNMRGGTEFEAGQSPDEKNGELPWTRLVSRALRPHPAELLDRLSSLPSAVRTTKVWETIRPVFSRLEALVQLQKQPAVETAGPQETEAYYSQLFCANRRLFEEWNVLRAEIISWLNWLPSFERIHRYVIESFPTGLASVDAAREQLLSSLAAPHVFMNEGPRESLEQEFARFRIQYAGYYEALHESTVGTAATRGKETAVDATGLRNLDLLSRLPYVDKKWFHRTRVKVQWLQRRRCNLPVREVLEDRPRCLCNFNPSGDRTLVDAVAELNELIRSGTESIRAFLRRGAAAIVQEASGTSLEEAAAQPIAALLSSGAMLPLTAESIEKLKEIMLRNPGPFHGAR